MPIGSTDTNSFGRTGWDVLVQYKFYFLALAAAVGFIVIDIVCPERVAEAFDYIDSWIEENKVFFIPFIAGAVLSRIIYKRYIFAPIFVHVENAEEGVSGWRFSRTYFDSLKKINGACNPIATKRGNSFFYAVSFNSDSREIDLGYIHSKDISPGEVFARRESYRLFLTSLHDALVRSVQLSDAPMVEGLRVAKGTVDSNLKIISNILGIEDERIELDPDKTLQELEKGVPDA